MKFRIFYRLVQFSRLANSEYAVIERLQINLSAYCFVSRVRFCLGLPCLWQKPQPVNLLQDRLKELSGHSDLAWSKKPPALHLMPTRLAQTGSKTGFSHPQFAYAFEKRGLL